MSKITATVVKKLRDETGAGVMVAKTALEEAQGDFEKAKEILKILQAIKKDYQKTDEALSVLNKHVTNAYNQSSQVTKSFSSLGQKLESTNLLAVEKEEKLIEQV